MYFKMLKSNVFAEYHCYFFDILHATILYPVEVEIRRGKCLTSEKELLQWKQYHVGR